MLSIIVPARDEQKRILHTLREIETFFETWPVPHEIIVVVNGTDRTINIVRGFAKKHEAVRWLNFHHPLGKGGAVHEGLKIARGDAVIYDADAATPAKEIRKLAAELKRYPIVIGSRRTPGARAQRAFYRRLASSSYNALIRDLFKLPFHDTQCGFKGMRRDAVKKLLPALRVKDFAWDVEMLVHARKRGLRVKEIPVEWRHVAGGKTTPRYAAAMVLTTLKLWRQEKREGNIPRF